MNDRATNPLAAPPELSALTPRESEILALVARGLSNSQVAAQSDVTVHAVKFHLASIYRKLHVANRTEAAAHFFEHLSRASSVHGHSPA